MDVSTLDLLIEAKAVDEYACCKRCGESWDVCLSVPEEYEKASCGMISIALNRFPRDLEQERNEQDREVQRELNLCAWCTSTAPLAPENLWSTENGVPKPTCNDCWIADEDIDFA